MNKNHINTSEQRKCSICLIVKPLIPDNFHKEKSRHLGYSYNCKSCEKIRSKAKYLKNPRIFRYKEMTREEKDKKVLDALEYRKKPLGRALSLISAYRKIDRKKGQEFNLTTEFLISNIFSKSCIYCGDTEKLGCDRINNSIGHITTNVVPSCKYCNIARMDNFTFEEMLIIGLAIKKVKEMRVNNLQPNHDSTR
jgi:hypothetical protein